jgi:phosphopantetheine--protein transferase-like protein
MHVLGIGTDLAHIERFRAVRHPERLAAFFLSPTEWKMAQMASDLPQVLASRFAAKEAVIKAVPEHMSPLSFEILKEGPKPVVRFITTQPYKVSLSITHERSYAAAVALCTSL